MLGNTYDHTPKTQRKRPPGTTPEAIENRMIALAMDVAEKQMRAGTASSQVISHFLKLGSTKEREEKEILVLNKELIKAKTESIQSGKRIEELYANAVTAMQTYSGNRRGDDDD